MTKHNFVLLVTGLFLIATVANATEPTPQVERRHYQPWVQVERLYLPEFLVEVEATAELPD